MKRTNVNILLVEDSPTDRLITTEALKKSQLNPTVDCVNDGVEALQYLQREAPYTDATRPDLILLDYNMPRMDGREVLATLKSDERLRSIPIIVLTTSAREEDIEQAYNRHANCFVTKPVHFAQFADAIKSIEQFWFSTATLPRHTCPISA